MNTTHEYKVTLADFTKYFSTLLTESKFLVFSTLCFFPITFFQFTEAEMSANSSHFQRPIIVPKIKLPVESIGYAECINAGKSRYNEDQASIILKQLRPKSSQTPINYLYIGLFDGHGGPGCALKASKELHQIVHEGFEDALEQIVGAYKRELLAGTYINFKLRKTLHFTNYLAFRGQREEEKASI